MKRKHKKVTAHDNMKILVKDENEAKPLVPLTGTDVAHMFTQRPNMKWEQYFLKEVDGDAYRYHSKSINQTKQNVPGLCWTCFH